MDLSYYDKNSLQQIHDWKNPQRDFLAKSFELISKPLSNAGELVLSTPVVVEAIQVSVQGQVGVCNDAALWSVRPEMIFEEFRKDGHVHINHYEHMETLRLKDIDRTVGWLAAKYKGIALA